jgi:tetratricopeptide (TPR) repeat protein
MTKSNLIQNNKDAAAKVFFIFWVCIIALRLSFAENSTIESFSLEGVFYDNLISICISAILFLAAVIWLVILLCRNNRRYKYTGFEPGIFLFIIAAVISTYFAPNRRAAMNDSLTMLGGIVGAAALAQVLESETRKKILIFVIIAMAIVNVYQCFDQYHNSNKMMIEQYKAEPEFQLERLGIERGSFQQMLYEHRLYSKDVKGFFATGNSAGCFFNLAIFSAIAVFAPGLKKFKEKKLKTFIFPILILLVLFGGLILTASKGAIISFVLAFIILLVSSKFADFLKVHKILIFITTASVFIAGVLLIVHYGLKHNALPGGNSMLVRWQYWTGAATIIADHFFTGVGGNNFGSFYTQYKIPEGLETVRDPHCFLLSVLSSYGIVGLAGFCVALFVPIIRRLNNPIPRPGLEKNNFVSTVLWCGISAVLVLLLLRPIAVRIELASNIAVALYIIAMMYAAPVFFFGVTLWLCVRSRESYDEFSVWTAPLLCGIFAVLLHNLIDFAIFEPGIMTALWASAALATCQSLPSNTNEAKKSSPLKKTFSIISVAALAGALLWMYIIPVGKTAVKIETAKMLSYYGRLNEATIILDSAADDDRLDPTPDTLKGVMLLQSYKNNPEENQEILFQAEKAFQTAIPRNPADFKNYDKLSDVYQSLAEAYPQQRLSWFEKAFESLSRAVNLYPSSAELHLTLATIAQQLNKIDCAIENYSQAIAIEDAYREQFKIMYPGKEIFSRLGEIKYNFAKERLEELTKKADNYKK